MGFMNQYYQTPIGEDTHKKLWLTTKYAGATGLLVSTLDVVLYSHPKGYLQTIGRYIYFTGPFVGIAGAFTLGVNMAASFRKKDDYLNYFIGSLAAGSLLGAWRKSMMVGFLGTVAVTAGSFTLKYGINEGWNFNKVFRTQLHSVNPKWYDFTLTKEYPRNWTTGKEDE